MAIPKKTAGQENEEAAEEKPRDEKPSGEKKRLVDRKGATSKELKDTRTDVVAGRFFSKLVMYFIVLSTASTLFKTGQHDIKPHKLRKR